jgi:FeS assembly protein SufD
MITWKRINLKNYTFPLVDEYKKEYINLEEGLPPGARLDKTCNAINSIKINWSSIREDKGLGKDFISYVNESYNSGISLYLEKNTVVDKPIMADFIMEKENPAVVDKNIIVAQPGSQAVIVFQYSTDGEVEAFHNGFTEIYAKENSSLTIIKIQRMNSLSHNFDTNVAYVKGGGRVNWITVELGSQISGTNYTTYLDEESSQGYLSSIYIGDGERKMDMSYSMIHRGRRSISHIEARGALMDNSRKVFRGNLDFRRGAKHAKGSEEEYVLLLDPTVKADSIPGLLCEEDDVEGEHAASAGQINENQLFYLMSRGLREKEAEKLIIEGSLMPIVDKIPIESLRQIINGEIRRRFADA